MNLQAGNVLTSGSTDLTIDLLLRKVCLYVVLHVILPPHGLLAGVTLVHHHVAELVSYLRHVAVKGSYNMNVGLFLEVFSVCLPLPVSYIIEKLSSGPSLTLVSSYIW